jgi:DNA modification methylase
MATLLLGDCIDKMKSLPAKSVDCFICDLPYGQLTNSNNAHKIKDFRVETDRTKQLTAYGNGCPWDIKLDLSEFWKQVKRLCKTDNTPVLMFCNTKFGFELYNSNPDWFRYDLVWNKQRGVSFLLSNKMPMKSHEMIYVFSKKGAYYKRVDIKTDKGEWTQSKKLISRQYSILSENRKDGGGKNGMRSVLSVINLEKEYSNKKLHPTEKPIELYKWLLERYCPPKGTVLDPTAGSFNSIWAARDLGFKAIGIEKDNTFFCRAVQTAFKRRSAPPPENVIVLNSDPAP